MNKTDNEEKKIDSDFTSDVKTTDESAAGKSPATDKQAAAANKPPTAKKTSSVRTPAKSNKPAKTNSEKSETEPVKDTSVQLTVERMHLEKPHFVMLRRDEKGRFDLAELWEEEKSLAIGAKTVEQIISEIGIDRDRDSYLITFSPKTGEVIAVV